MDATSRLNATKFSVVAESQSFFLISCYLIAEAFNSQSSKKFDSQYFACVSCFIGSIIFTSPFPQLSLQHLFSLEIHWYFSILDLRDSVTKS